MRFEPTLPLSRLWWRLAAGATLAGFIAACDKPAANDAPPAAAKPAGAEVVLRPFAELARPLEREAAAQVIARNEARLSAELAAPIRELPFDVGQAVKAGEVLVRLEARDTELALAQADAAVEQAKAKVALVDSQYARAKDLRERNFASGDALQQRETERLIAAADLKVAHAARDTARRAVEKTVLRAPFSGVVKSRSGQLGELAAPGTPLITLVEAGALEVAAQVPLRDADSLRQGERVRFVSARGDAPLKLLRLSPVVNRESRTVEARLRADSGGQNGGKAAIPELAPGDDGKIVWADARPALTAEWLVKRGEVFGVFIAEQGKAKFVAVPGAREGRPTTVALPPDTLVVTDGRNALADGQALNTNTPIAPATPAAK